MEQDIIPACVVVVVVVVVRSLVDVVKAVCSIMLLSSADIAISAQLTNISGRYPGELPKKSQFHFFKGQSQIKSTANVSTKLKSNERYASYLPYK